MKYLKFVDRKDRGGLKDGLVKVNFNLIDIKDTDMADRFLENPSLVTQELKVDLEADVMVKNIPDSTNIPVSELKATNVNNFISIKGIINQTSLAYSKKTASDFECYGCNEITHMKHDLYVRKPYQCKYCGGKRFREDSYLTDDEVCFYVMEDLNNINHQPFRLRCLLPGKLCTNSIVHKLYQIGLNVKVSGILREVPIENKPGRKTKNALLKYLEVISVEFSDDLDIVITNEDIEQIKDLSQREDVMDTLIGSFAPLLIQDKEIKAPVILQLFGGADADDGKDDRKDIHVLLIGDPSCGKSKILDFVNKVAPKSKLVSGAHTTGVGLTAAISKDDDGKFYASAGAMVLAKGGIMACDEFGEISKDDQAKMKDAMARQLVSINKAGISTDFDTKTAVIAACNPKNSSFDRYQDIISQFKIESALLSRFDMIILFFDNPNKEKDAQIADAILRGTKGKDSEVSIELFKKYILYAKQNYPVVKFPIAVSNRLNEKYVEIRDRSTEDRVTMMPRNLDGIKRLAQARAKIGLRNRVTVADLEYVWDLYLHWMKEANPDKSLDALSNFTGVLKTSRDADRYIDAVYDELKILGDVRIEVLLEKVVEKTHNMSKAKELLKNKKDHGDYFEPRIGILVRI